MITFFLPKYKRFLELDADTKITITVTTPLTDVDYVSRVYSFEFNAPINPNNDVALRHVHRIDSTFGAQNVVCECHIGELFAVGTLSVATVQNGNYRINFKSTERNILTELEFDISTLAQESISLVPVGTVIDYNQYVFALDEDWTTVDDTYYPVMMMLETRLFESSITGFNLQYEDTLAVLASDINIFAGATIATVTGAYREARLTVNIPLDANEKPKFNWNFTRFVRIKMMSQQTAPEHNNSLMVSKMDSMNRDETSDIVFPTVYAPNLYSGNLAYYYHINMCGLQGEIMPNVLQSVKNECINSYVPMFRVRYVLKKIAAQLNLTIGGDWYNEAEAQRLIIFNSFNLDKWSEQDSYEGIGISTRPTQKYINVGNPNIVPANHLPKVTARVFLQQLCHDLGCYIEVSDGLLLLQRKKDLLQKLAKNRTQDIISNSIVFAPRTNSNVKIAYSFDTETVVPTGQLTPLSTNPNAITSIDYVLQNKTLIMTKFLILNEKLVPYYFGKANSETTALLFYRGIQTSKDGSGADIPYAFATHDVYTHDGTKIGDWSLSPSGENGLYEKGLRGIAELEAISESNCELSIEASGIIAMRKANFGRIFAYTPVGFFEGIPKQVRLRFANRSLDSVSMIFLVL